MSKEFVGSARERAEELVAHITDPLGEPLTPNPSAACRAEVTDALEDDLISADRDSAAGEDRLLKLEAQTHGLAEAVIAITEPSISIGPAVQAVKDEM